MLNLDTHILIHAVGGTLTEREHELLISEEWGVSDIVLWEIEMLWARRRVGFGLDHPALIEALCAIQVWPITPEVCFKLRTLDFRSDPADEIIAATSLAHDVALVTRDARIRSSRLVRFA